MLGNKDRISRNDILNKRNKSHINEGLNSNLKINKDGLTEEEFLRNYNPGNYERPSVTVDMLLFTIEDTISDDVRKLDKKELKILLIKRKDHPYLGQWALPGGFVNKYESLDTAAYRELREETNIDNVYMEQLATFGDNVVEGEPRDPRTWVISTAYMALIPNRNLKPIAGDDAQDVDWFTVKKGDEVETEDGVEVTLILENEEKNAIINYKITEKHSYRGVTKIKEPSYKLDESSTDSIAFDHYKMIDMAIDRLRNKIEYTSIAFNLVNEYFTISELQSIFELILNRKFHRMEFTRKIKNMIVETDMLNSEKGHRPAKYYKYNKDWGYKF